MGPEDKRGLLATAGTGARGTFAVPVTRALPTRVADGVEGVVVATGFFCGTPVTLVGVSGFVKGLVDAGLGTGAAGALVVWGFVGVAEGALEVVAEAGLAAGTRGGGAVLGAVAGLGAGAVLGAGAALGAGAGLGAGVALTAGAGLGAGVALTAEMGFLTSGFA